ncbi:MAG: efflux RND transporter periplasmic adaptor subunit [Patescibacteria group bacterium]
MKNLMRKKLLWIAVGAIVVIGGIWYANSDRAPEYETITATVQAVVQEVSVTGTVTPSEAVDLAFEKSGRVASVSTRVGDKVIAGQQLAALASADVAAQLAESEAALLTQQAKLNELKRGMRAEELRIKETKVITAERVLTDAIATLDKTEQKASADLDEDYNAAITTAEKSISVATHALFVITDIQNAHFSGYDQQSIQIADKKAVAVLTLLGAPGAGKATNTYISQLSGGAKATVAKAQASQEEKDIEQALAETAAALAKTKEALDAVPVISSLTTTETTNLNAEKTNVNAEISAVAGKQQAIATQTATNNASVAAAQANVNAAQNALEEAKDAYALAVAGATPEELAAQEAQVVQAHASAQNFRAQLAKLVLFSPIAGTVTRQDAKVGEIVGANAVVISVISVANFEIEAFIPEADIAKITVGNEARVTLDAYGNDVVFSARVAAVDPAETVVEGVSTYKTTLSLADNDGRIKSGMTANVDIVTNRRENAIAVPQRAVNVSDAHKMMKILEPDGTVRESTVTTGIIGTDGSIEITSGITEGDVIIVSISEQ